MAEPPISSSALIDVRPATPDDADALLPLIHAHAAYEGGMASVEAHRLRAALGGASPALHGWLAEQHGGVIGYATAAREFATWSGSHFLHLDCLFVVQFARGSGAGRMLMNAVRAHAIATGIDQVEWQTPAWNEDACRFYLRMGATSSDKRRFKWPVACLLDHAARRVCVACS